MSAVYAYWIQIVIAPFRFETDRHIEERTDCHCPSLKPLLVFACWSALHGWEQSPINHTCNLLISHTMKACTHSLPDCCRERFVVCRSSFLPAYSLTTLPAFASHSFLCLSEEESKAFHTPKSSQASLPTHCRHNHPPLPAPLF